MKKIILVAAMILASFAARAEKDDYYQDVTGEDVLSDHYLNQYDDVTNPPQAYRIRVPAGYSLIGADVKSDGTAVCGVSEYSVKNKTLKFKAFDIETDSGSCTLTLILLETKTEKEVKAKYEIVQVGT